MVRKIRVLVFDNDKCILLLMKSILERFERYDVFFYEDPYFVSLNSKHKCDCGLNCLCSDLIISDINMHYVNGLDFIEEQLSKGCKIDPKNILILSGEINEETIKRIKNIGAFMLSKPFKLKDLHDWLEDRGLEVNTGIDLIDSNILKKGTSDI